MNGPDRIYFSDLPVDPDLESMLEYDDLFEFIPEEKPYQLREPLDCNDPEDYFDWDFC